MQPRGEQTEASIQALRSEGRLRAWYVTILAGTIAVLYLSNSFPAQFDLFPWAKQASNVVTGTILFLICLVVIAGLERIWTAYRRSVAEFSVLRSPTVRRLLRELNGAVGIQASAVAMGSNDAGNISSLRLRRHLVVAIGRGALPRIVRDPQVFRYRIAHEYAHLAAGDPDKDRWVAVVYGTALIFLGASYGSALYNQVDTVASLWRVGGWSAAAEALTGRMLFGIEANLTLFGSILLVLSLELRSATRLNEFYADAAATSLVGPIVEAFGSAAPSPRSIRNAWSIFFGRHPAAIARSKALGDRMIVYRGDMILFALQGFFSAFIVEIVLQLMFATASAGLATFDDRRASLGSWRLARPW
jgi:Peptidase family M48